MRADIITVTHGNVGSTMRCFRSLREYTDDYNLVWVDNGSSKECRNAVMTEMQMHPFHTTVWLASNMGFILGTNTALRILKRWEFPSPYVVLLNNDVEVTKGWLNRMMSIMDKDPTVYAVGPVTSECTSWQSFQHAGEILPMFQVPDGFAPLNTAERAAKLDYCYSDVYRKVNMLAFFCTLFRREAFLKLGFLDESFGVGLGDDDDFCYRMGKGGMDCAFSMGTYVRHEHRATFKTLYTDEQYKDMKKDRFARFREKHGCEPSVHEVKGAK